MMFLVLRGFGVSGAGSLDAAVESAVFVLFISVGAQSVAETGYYRSARLPPSVRAALQQVFF